MTGKHDATLRKPAAATDLVEGFVGTPQAGRHNAKGGRDKVVALDATRSREIVGGVSAFALVLEGKHACDVLAEPLDMCSSAWCAAAHIWGLPDLQFGGFILYSAILVLAVVGLSWAMWPTFHRLRRLLSRTIRKRCEPPT